jgi:hypothetical protein
MNPMVVAVLVLLFVWATAEAFAWPVVPDAALAVVAFMAPQLALPALGAVVMGTTLGGAIAISAWRRGVRWPLPMATDSMRTRVHRWLDNGPVGLIYQPLTAVPYKVFVVDAAWRDFSVGTWAALTAGFRGARMLAVTVISVFTATVVSNLAEPDDVLGWKLAMLGAGTLIFLAGWRIVWVMWSKPKVAEVGSSV